MLRKLRILFLAIVLITVIFIIYSVYGEKTTWIVVFIFGILVSGIRLFLANRKSKKQAEIHDKERLENASALDSIIRSTGINAESRIDTCRASFVLDKEGKLTGISSGEKIIILLDDLESAVLYDLSEKYIHAQKMEAYYTGVHRTSMYRPYGGFSTKEVKQGHEDFLAFNGAMVYGLQLQMKSGEVKEYPFFSGDDTLFWNETDRLVEARKFVGKLSEAISSWSKNQ